MDEKKMFDLSGKSALVTGAGSGIGESVAHGLARAGAFVYVTDRDEKNGRRVAEDVAEAGGAPSSSLWMSRAKERVRARSSSCGTSAGRWTSS